MRQVSCLIKITQVPGDYNLYGLLGSTYFIMDNSEKAFESWEKGIATSSSSHIVYRVIANYAIENRAYEKAIENLVCQGDEFFPDLENNRFYTCLNDHVYKRVNPYFDPVLRSLSPLVDGR